MLSLTRISHRLLAFAAFLLLLASNQISFSQTTATKPEARKLELGKPIERELKGGESHTYEITLIANQFLNAVVEQKGIDVVVQVIAPDGKQILEVDSPNGDKGDEPVTLITEMTGVFKVNVQSLEKKVPVGKYEIRIKELRAATDTDHVLITQNRALQEATKLTSEARGLRVKGNYDEALLLSKRALAIREKALGRENPDIVESLNDLAGLYNTKGDYINTEPLLIRALAVNEKVFGTEHSKTADALSNLAALYGNKGDFAKAEPLFLRALAINEKVFGKEHRNTASTLHSLAGLYTAKGDYAKAEPLLTHALSIREKSLGSEHRLTASTLHSLAGVYDSKGDFAKAEPLYIRALETREKILGAEHPLTANIFNNLARLNTAKSNYAKAIELQTRCNEIQERDHIRNLASGSERQKLLYLTKSDNEYNFTISLHINFAPKNPDALRLAAPAVLRFKGRAFDAMNDAVAVLRHRASADDLKLLDQLTSLRAQLSVLTLRGPGREGSEKYKANLKALADEAEKLESQISQRSLEFRAQLMSINLENVQQAIPTNTALVEFAAYRPFNPKEPDKKKQYGEPRYVAYVLRKNGGISHVELGDVATIDEQIAAYRQKIDEFRVAYGKKDSRRKSRTIRANRFAVRRLARSVDKLVMQPVRRLLGSTRRVFLSPDGNLNLLPFAALIDERGEYLVKNYHFTYLTSGRDLLRLQTKAPGKAAKMVIANPDFGKEATASNDAPTTGMLDRFLFPSLPATKDEAAALHRLFPEATVMTAQQATESALKAADRPALLHIATHGFFLNDEMMLEIESDGNTARGVLRRKLQNNDAEKELVNPLMRSGLALMGANARSGGNGEDGILTASEAAGLDLWGTKLVVLSACETGLGKVVSGDGVYGLRRALVLAGSEAQMMSLWPVDDEGTRELMIGYYKRLKAGAGRSAALRQTQLRLLTNPQLNHPYFWASFLQSGEWANLDGKREEK